MAYAAILHLSELQGIRECKTKMRGKGSGTHDVDLQAAFAARGISTHQIGLPDGRVSQFWWLPQLSLHFPLYVAVKDRKNGSTHAIAVANRMVYDGHNDSEVPLELYADKWMDSVIVVDKELDTYQSN